MPRVSRMSRMSHETFALLTYCPPSHSAATDRWMYICMLVVAGAVLDPPTYPPPREIVT